MTKVRVAWPAQLHAGVGSVEMTNFKNNDESLTNNAQDSARTWRDVAQDIVNEPESEKLAVLVKELCDLLDHVPKGPSSVHVESFGAKTERWK
jgi:hypothetical protein